MNKQLLFATANELVADTRGLLAMDEINPTCNKRFAKSGIQQCSRTANLFRSTVSKSSSKL